jgi:hypothetical protein
MQTEAIGFLDVRLGAARVSVPRRGSLPDDEQLQTCKRPVSAKWISRFATSSVLDIYQEAPAREPAHDWINDDLRRIRWSDATIGRRY